METRIYPYLGEHNIGIKGPKKLLDRIEGNIEEAPLNSTDYEGIVRISEGIQRELIRNKDFPYLSLRENNLSGKQGLDYIRYNTHIRTIWQNNSLDYSVKNHLKNDETGALKSFKRIYYSLPRAKNKSLLHAATVDLDGLGVLIVGKKRAGKTVLAFNMIDQIGARLVEGGTTLVSYGGDFSAYYVPRPVFARFNTIAESPYLSILLNDLEKTESIQPWDIEAIQKIIKNRSFKVDGGLNLSRRVFSNLSGTKTLPSTKIRTIIFPNYSKNQSVTLKDISIDEAYKFILEREFEINTSLDNLQDQENIKNPPNSKLQKVWLEGLSFKSISFDGNKDMGKTLLEDLIA